MRAGLCLWLAVGLWACDGATPSSPVSQTGERVLRVSGGPSIHVQDVVVPARRALEVALRGFASVRCQVYLWDPERGIEVARGAQLVHWNRDERPRALRLFALGRGAGDLSLDGGHRRISLASERLGVPGGRGFRYHAVAAPGGPGVLHLLGFDATGRLVALAEGRSAVAFSADTVIEVALAGDVDGPVRIYVNDPDDQDGDGLGARLEQALGTCDAADQPGCADSLLAPYYRRVRHATRDTDRDGLPDDLELFGAPELELPRWGADPRHKDVFVELDHVKRLGRLGVDEDDLVAVAELYAEGSAAALRNPDGEPGVHLHFDAGLSPTAPEHRSLVGDWGGSQKVSSARYRRMRDKHFTRARHGVFRYGLATPDGTGQAHGDAFAFNHHFHRERVLAHELAHTLGLSHFGHARWGEANCKPHYVSLMNYLFQNRDGVGFARGPVPVLDPSALLERDALLQLPGLTAELLRDPPLELDVVGDHVDWNRDGLISDVPVRAALTWATFKSCSEPSGSRTQLGARPVPWGGGAPVLLRTQAGLEAYWLDRAGRLYGARAALRPLVDARGPCPLGEGRDRPCTRFSTPELVDPGPFRFVAGVARDEQTWLAMVDGPGAMRLQRPLHTGARTELSKPTFLLGATTDHAPALLIRDVDAAQLGVSRLLSVFYRRPDGQLWVAELDLGLSVTRLRAVVTSAGATIETGLGPAVAQLGTGETCGVFADRAQQLRFYCRDDKRGAWQDLSDLAFYEGLGPRSEGPIALAYVPYRTAEGFATGSEGTGERGAVYVAFSVDETAYEPRSPWWLISEWLSPEHGARARIRFRWRGRVTDQWANLPEGAGLAVQADSGHLRALLPLQPIKQPDASLRFLPFAHGSYPAELAGGNDFEVMERGICLGIRSEAACGGPETGTY